MLMSAFLLRVGGAGAAAAAGVGAGAGSGVVLSLGLGLELVLYRSPQFGLSAVGPLVLAPLWLKISLMPTDSRC